METAKSQKTAQGRHENPGSDRYFAVILKEITGKRGEKDAAARLRLFVEDGSLVSCAWRCRKWPIRKPIERHEADRLEIDLQGRGI